MNELSHHGILGQKWGVRRYQNEDGTLTEAGKKKYKKYSNDAIRKKHLNSKNNNQLSNNELQELNYRLNLENQRKNNSARNFSTGKQYVKAVLAISSAATVTTLASKYGPKAIEKAGSFVKKHGKEGVTILTSPSTYQKASKFL